MKRIVAILVSILALAACNSTPKEQIAIDDNSNQVVSFYDVNGRVFKKDI
ncbi:lipoprotein, partial [Vibrio metoecus]